MEKFKVDSLYDKYNGFKVPTFKISIGGYDISKDFAISALNVELTSELESSLGEFEIIDGFEYIMNKMSMNKKLSSKLKLGVEVKISVGYSKQLEEIFIGYIDNINIEYYREEGFSIHVQCLDVKGIMMNSYRSELKVGAKSYSDAAKKVFSNYGTLIGSQKVEKSSDVDITINQHNESDYNFLVRLAKKINYEFFVINKDVYFQSKGKDKSEILKVEMGNYLISLSMKQSLKNRVGSVVVRNNIEQDEKKEIEAKETYIDDLATGRKEKSSNSKVINSKVVKTIIDESIMSKELAKKRAEAEITRLSYETIRGTVEVLGTPEIVPGKFIKLSGLGESIDNKYYIRKVTHSIRNMRFTTTFEIGGNTI